MNYLYDFLIVCAAVLTVDYLRGFIFVAFRADKYEDVLALKVAKEVKEHLEKKGTKE